MLRNMEQHVCSPTQRLGSLLPFRFVRIGKTVLYVGLPGLEPGTSSLSEKRSNRLSYRPEAEVAAGIIYNTEVILTSRLNTGEAGSTIGTVSESHYASRCERSI
jgi:hypothetical protein